MNQTDQQQGVALLSDPGQTEAVGERAWHVHQRILEVRADIELRFIALGGLLKTYRGERLYEGMGHSSFESYLADPEVSISRSHAYRLIDAFEDYHRLLPQAAVISEDGEVIREARPGLLSVEDLALVGVRKAGIIAPLVRESQDPEEVRSWVEEAKTLAVSDLSKRVKDVRRQDPRTADQLAREEMLERLSFRLAGSAKKLTHDPDPASVLQHIIDVAQAGLAAL